MHRGADPRGEVEWDSTRRSFQPPWRYNNSSGASGFPSGRVGSMEYGGPRAGFSGDALAADDWHGRGGRMQQAPPQQQMGGGPQAWRGDDARASLLSRYDTRTGSSQPLGAAAAELLSRHDGLVSAYASTGHLSSQRLDGFPRPDYSVMGLDPSTYPMPPPSPPGPQSRRTSTLSFEEVVNRGESECSEPSLNRRF